MNFEALPYSLIQSLLKHGRNVPRSFSRAQHDDQGHLQAVFNQFDRDKRPLQIAIPCCLGTLQKLHEYTRDFAADYSRL